MLTLNYLRNNKQEAIERLHIRNIDSEKIINKVIEKDDLRKETQKKLDDILAQVNSASKQIGELFKNGKTDEANELKSKTSSLKTDSKSLNELLTNTENDI